MPTYLDSPSQRTRSATRQGRSRSPAPKPASPVRTITASQVLVLGQTTPLRRTTTGTWKRKLFEEPLTSGRIRGLVLNAFLFVICLILFTSPSVEDLPDVQTNARQQRQHSSSSFASQQIDPKLERRLQDLEVTLGKVTKDIQAQFKSDQQQQQQQQHVAAPSKQQLDELKAIVNSASEKMTKWEERIGRRLTDMESTIEILKRDLSKFETNDDPIEKKVEEIIHPKLTILKNELKSEIAAISSSKGSAAKAEPRDIISDVQSLVQKSLQLIQDDFTGRADYAQISAGASVVRTETSPTYWGESPSGSWLVNALLLPSPPAPEKALSTGNEVGSCWPCRVGDCRLTVKLAARIKLTHVSLEHVSTALSIRPVEEDSAPKEFSVVVNNKVVGSFTYQRRYPWVQTFAIPNSKIVTNKVTLEIHSSHGLRAPFVCLYRFRVHGDFVSAS